MHIRSLWSSSTPDIPQPLLDWVQHSPYTDGFELQLEMSMHPLNTEDLP